MGKRLRCGLAFAALFLTVAGAAHAQYLYWIDTNFGAPVLRRAQVYGNFQSEVALAPGSLPEGLAYSPASGRLVFGESAFTGAAIRQTTPAFTAPLAIVSGQSCVRGVAVHPATGDVFWTTSNLVTGSELWRCDAGGNGAQALLNFGGTANLRGIAIDAAGGKLYFTDFDQNLILRANLDGTSLEVFHFLGAVAGPWGVLFDPAGQRVFWSEYVSGRIRTLPSSGGAVATTVYDGLANPTYLERLPDGGVPDGFFLLWSEAGVGAQRIALAFADGSGAFTTNLPVSSYGGLAYVPGDALAVDPAMLLPPELSLAPVSPNPATAATVVQLSLPVAAHARLTLVDVQGRRVATLLDGPLPAGRHPVPLAPVWAAHRPAAGVYFLRLEAGGRLLARKFVVAN
jgi:hypothetical protein